MSTNVVENEHNIFHAFNALGVWHVIHKKRVLVDRAVNKRRSYQLFA